MPKGKSCIFGNHQLAHPQFWQTPRSFSLPKGRGFGFIKPHVNLFLLHQTSGSFSLLEGRRFSFGKPQATNAVVWYEDRLFFLVIVRIFKPVALCWFWNCGVYWLLGLVLLCFLHACNIYKSLLPSPVSSALNPKLPPLCLSRETGKDN